MSMSAEHINKIVIASDSFKGSLTQLQVGAACEAAVRSVLGSDAVTHIVEVADGGEGTSQALMRAYGCHEVACRVTGPYGRSVVARYGVNGDVAVMEMAAASGLHLADGRRDVVNASSVGTGQMLRHAVESGCRKVIIGLGGSATSDGGMGMLAGLGVVFADERGNAVEPVAANMCKAASADFSAARQLLDGVEIIVAADVVNPYYGPTGAAHVFGPQKGASVDDVDFLDRGMRHLNKAVHQATGVDMQTIA